MIECKQCGEVLLTEIENNFREIVDGESCGTDSYSLEGLAPTSPQTTEAQADRESKASESKARDQGPADNSDSDIRKKAAILLKVLESESDDSDETGSESEDMGLEASTGIWRPFRGLLTGTGRIFGGTDRDGGS